MLQVTQVKLHKQDSQENISSSIQGSAQSPCSDYQTQDECPETGNLRCLQRYNYGSGIPNSRCEASNDNVVKVGSRDECEALARERCDSFFSFRANAGTGGRHKCITSPTCFPPEQGGTAVIGTTTGDWGIHATPFSSLVQRGAYQGCYSGEGIEADGPGGRATSDDPGDTFVNCMSFCVCRRYRFMALMDGGARCVCANSPPTGERGDDSMCDVQGDKCTSDNTWKCGGEGHSAVYGPFRF